MKRAAVLVSPLVSLLATCAIAHADAPAVALVPSCAEVDTAHDALAPGDREAARKLLVRVLERAELLVVETGCVDHYSVSHEQEGETLTIHLRGPRGRRRMRHVKQAELATNYARMIEALVTADQPAEASAPDAAPAAPDAAPAAPDAAPAAPDATDNAAPDAAADTTSRPDAGFGQAPMYSGGSPNDSSSFDEVTPEAQPDVTPDRLLYGQLGIGTYGAAYAIGYRRGDRNHALDVSLSWADGDNGGFVAAAVEGLYVASPHSSTTPYIGSGLSLASQDQDGMSGAGIRLEATAGIAFARTSALRWFTQVDLALPTYQVGMGIAPTGSISLGAGF